MNKKENKHKGDLGEDLACSYLEKKGYTILTRNFNCFYGEIDIIAHDNNELIFIEVKTRYQNSYGEPIEAVNTYKKFHLYNTAKYYLYKSNLLDAPIRFDIIEINIYENEDFKISHTQNVITEEPTKIIRRKD